MPNSNKRYPSRMDKRNRTNSVLNILIVLVFGLIAITAAFIIIGGGDEGTDLEQVTIADEPAETGTADDGGGGTEQPATDGEEEGTDSESEEDTVGGTVTREDSDDPLVEETIVNTSWEPIGTEQTGEHVSRYDGSSVDWQEKLAATAYATGLNADEMIVWMIENGGGPQKSVAVVSNSGNTEHFRVYLQWVDGEGWKPEKVDVLTTAEGAY